MSPTRFLTFLVIGGVAGWLTGLILKGRGFGLAGTGMRRLQTGLVRQYALGIAAGMAALLLWAVWRKESAAHQRNSRCQAADWPTRPG